MNLPQKDFRAELENSWPKYWQQLKNGNFQYTTMQTAFNPSDQLMRLAILTDMQEKSGVPVPPDMLIDNTPLEEDAKDRWKAFVRMQTSIAQNAALSGGTNGGMPTAAKVRVPTPA